ncbi:MAG TPA: AmmeMemoRadiSam system protein A [Spirochaetota bacterium]|nr:AmmeMemoRadiSam system protein A [Spirochaetota bacterium]
MIELNKIQQRNLLILARKTIAQRLGVDFDSGTLDFSDEIFKEKCGAFVTLHINGNLRGCIGYIEGVHPIPDTIREMALAAAFRDPRFAPLSKGEYKLIDIEISILSPIERVDSIDDIVVGRDGLIITRGFNRGLLLPQVPVEQGWDRETFLTHTCFKAGLPGDSWKKKDTLIEKFSAQVFSEKEHNLV